MRDKLRTFVVIIEDGDYGEGVIFPEGTNTLADKVKEAVRCFASESGYVGAVEVRPIDFVEGRVSIIADISIEKREK